MGNGLRQVLEVYRQVRQFGLSRIEATKLVSKDYRIEKGTVMSACTRYLVSIYLNHIMFAHDLCDSHSGQNYSFFQL